MNLPVFSEKNQGIWALKDTSFKRGTSSTGLSSYDQCDLDSNYHFIFIY